MWHSSEGRGVYFLLFVVGIMEQRGQPHREHPRGGKWGRRRDDGCVKICQHLDRYRRQKGARGERQHTNPWVLNGLANGADFARAARGGGADIAYYYCGGATGGVRCSGQPGKD